MNGTLGALGSSPIRPWLLAHFVAFTIGGAVAGGVLRALEQPYYGRATSALDAGVIQGGSLAASMAMFGAILGAGQWLVLRRSLPAGGWVAAAALGWGLSGIVMGFTAGGSVSGIGPDEGPVPAAITAVVGPPVVVVVLGLVQWMILRREFTGAGWWPLVNAAGLFLGVSVGLVVAKVVPWLTPTQFPSGQAFALMGAIAGPIYGVITWQFLTELRRPGAPSPTDPGRSR
ncbi:MAG TPA: hypothetical protein VN773_01020 [Verrucomicrobiae bacterium]|jgi:hypothetical protein|nr:hypothetical protein [Verrucomicrobiae bacterium]